MLKSVPRVRVGGGGGANTRPLLVVIVALIAVTVLPVLYILAHGRDPEGASGHAPSFVHLKSGTLQRGQLQKAERNAKVCGLNLLAAGRNASALAQEAKKWESKASEFGAESKQCQAKLSKIEGDIAELNTKIATLQKDAKDPMPDEVYGKTLNDGVDGNPGEVFKVGLNGGGARDRISRERIAKALTLFKHTEFEDYPFWENQAGVHIIPVHYYSSFPDTHQVRRISSRTFDMAGVDMRLDFMRSFVKSATKPLQNEFAQLAKVTKPSDRQNYHTFRAHNGMFNEFDSGAYYTMIRHFKPKRVLEVGSGETTLLAVAAANNNKAVDGVETNVRAIEPFPPPILKEGFPGFGGLIHKKVEEVPLSTFMELEENDILFIDSSHVLRAGNDVAFLYMEVIPHLKPGVVVHVHDIFFPLPYPRAWMQDMRRGWNEQYLLWSFLMFNSEWDVLFCNSYMSAKGHEDELKRGFGDLGSIIEQPPYSGSFWMQRKPNKKD